MSSSNIKRKLAEAQRVIRMQTAAIEALRAELAAAQATARRLAEADQSARTLTEQRDRLVQLCDGLGRNLNDYTEVFQPAATIALDPVRWGDWIDGRPQMRKPSSRFTAPVAGWYGTAAPASDTTTPITLTSDDAIQAAWKERE